MVATFSISSIGHQYLKIVINKNLPQHPSLSGLHFKSSAAWFRSGFPLTTANQLHPFSLNVNFCNLAHFGMLTLNTFFKCFTFEKLSLSTQSITFHQKSRNLSVLNFVSLNWSGYFDGQSLTDCSAFHGEACSAQHRCFVVHMLSIKYGCSF